MKERYLLEDGSDNGFSLITDYDGNDEQAFDVNVKSGEILPVLPLRNMVLFPGVFLPITVGRKSSLKLIRDADKKHKDIAVVCQRSAHTEDPKLEDLHNIGTVGRIVRILEMPDQTTTVILQGMKRLNLINIIETHPYLKGEIELLEEDIPSKDDKEFQALVETCKDLTMRYIKSSDVMHQDSAFAIKNINSPMFLVNFICSNLPFKKDEKMDLLSIHSLRERTYHLLEILNREVQLAEIKASIQMRAREDIDQQQREYFLQQQIKTIQDELGGGGQEQEIEEMRQKAERMRWNAEVRETFMKELAKLERTHPQSPDYSVQLNYLQTMLNLPWGTYTTDNLNLKNAEKTLNKDHYGLEKVKERILEHLAVLKLKGDMKSPIICLYGPPGVGKTSLGKSIASALKRKYVRMSLGGVHDEAEIRGHRKTYIGAMPGRIIKSLIKAGASNPVFILDEIDKVSADRQGDPSSALLEVLDPEHSGINLFDENWKIYSRNSGRPCQRIGTDADIVNSMITEGCQVDGTVKNSILFPGVVVEKGATVEAAVVMGGTVIKAGAKVEHCIVAENVTIEEGATVGKMPESGLNITEPGDVATVGSGVKIGKGATVGPKAMISNDVKDGEEQW